MIDHWKIWFVSLIRGKRFPGPIITQVNVNHIPHHSRLTWPGSCLPFPQSPQHAFYTLCSTKSYKSMPPCSFIFAFAPSTLSVLDTLARTCLHVQVYSDFCGSHAVASVNPPSLPFLRFPSASRSHELITACSALCLLVFMSYISLHWTRNSWRAGQE